MSLLSPDWVAAIGTWAGAAITLITLYVIWKQLGDLKSSIRSSTTQNIYVHMIAIDRFFIDHPKVKPYFYAGKSIDAIDAEELAKLLSIAEMMVDYFDSVYQQRDCVTQATFDGKGEYMRELYANSPILRAYLEGKDDWYDKQFVRYLRGT